MLEKGKYILFGLISFTLLLSVDFARAESGEAGAAGAYLRMGVGARALGMGDAYTAICDDVYATYWNPAGLTQIQEHQIGTMYAIMSFDRKHNFLNYAGGLGKDLGLGISWINFGVGGIEERDGRGNLIKEFESSESTYYLSLAKGLGEKFSLGGNIKYLGHKLLNNMASGFGLDAGVLFKPTEALSLGLMFQDIGSKVKWDTPSGHEDSFPLNIRGGAALRLLKDRLILATDLEKSQLQSMKFHLGAEYKIIKNLTARLGYNDKEFTAGAGFGFPVLRFDYGYAADRLRKGDTHRISILVRFGGREY